MAEYDFHKEGLGLLLRGEVWLETKKALDSAFFEIDYRY